MIQQFHSNVNNFDKNIFKNCTNYDSKKDYIQSLMPNLEDITPCKCPKCHAKNSLIKYGHYSRHISIFSDNELFDFYVKVQRVKCNGCKSTHALLPNFVVPYVILSIFSIATIIQDVSRTSISSFLNKTNFFYEQIIYFYLNLAKLFFQDFKKLNSKYEMFSYDSFTLDYFLQNNFDCLTTINRYNFFKFHNWIIYMKKFQNNSSPPISILCTNLSPT